MPITLVQCSLPGCNAEATYKVASPWKEGRFAEVKTLGYCCQAHVEKVVARISQRPRSDHPMPGEMRVYNLPRE